MEKRRQDMKGRTKKYAISVLKYLETLPYRAPYIAITNQLSRSSMSVGANYRAALRGKSTADFINKLKIVEEECDETVYFLEILIELRPIARHKTESLINEGNELLAMTVASIKTVRERYAGK
jgi:four helix bundle protein